MYISYYFCIVDKSCSAVFVMAFIRVGSIGHRTHIFMYIYFFYNEILHASIRTSSPI